VRPRGWLPDEPCYHGDPDFAQVPHDDDPAPDASPETAMRPLIVMRCVTAVLLSAGAACAAAQDDGRGALRVAGPVRAGGLCIENAQVMAALGGLMIMGTLCDGTGPQ
jgi:hypothetical protein